MNKVDIRKIYVCKIAKQSAVAYDSQGTISVCGKTYELEANHRWGYDEPQYGLFVKARLGFVYKHILTGAVYPIADSSTGGKYVIVPGTTEKLIQKERELCNHLISKYKTYDLYIDAIQTLEERINEEAKFIEENDGLSQ